MISNSNLVRIIPRMSRWKVAQQIRASIIKREFLLRYHAQERLAERRFLKEDVIEIAKTAVRWEWQDTKKPIFSLEWTLMAMVQD